MNLQYLLGETWVGHAPAKLNLFFEVLDKRNDGYHNVFSVCCPVSLYDRLFFLPKNQRTIDFSVRSCSHDIQFAVPHDSGNLVLKALELLRETCQVDFGGIVFLEKRIPVQAGLGGGSSDAATAIMLANSAWKLGLDRKQMMEIGAKLGSDVPLFFAPGASLGTGRGEVIEPIFPFPKLDFVLVKPACGISTQKAFAELKQKNGSPRKNPAELIQRLKQGNLRFLHEKMFNRLESIGKKLSPAIHDIDDAMSRLDLIYHQMTGSGTAYFGLCRNRCHANHVAARLKNMGLGAVFTVSSL